jgi:hypothetical protein
VPGKEAPAGRAPRPVAVPIEAIRRRSSSPSAMKLPACPPRAARGGAEAAVVDLHCAGAVAGFGPGAMLLRARAASIVLCRAARQRSDGSEHELLSHIAAAISICQLRWAFWLPRSTMAQDLGRHCGLCGERPHRDRLGEHQRLGDRGWRIERTLKDCRDGATSCLAAHVDGKCVLNQAIVSDIS